MTETEPGDDDLVTWATDLDRDGWPTYAHRIISTETDAFGEEVRVTACGRRLTRHNHPRGWRKVKAGETPFQDPYNHCGADAENLAAADPAERG